jgi:hypothetical protein
MKSSVRKVKGQRRRCNNMATGGKTPLLVKIVVAFRSGQDNNMDSPIEASQRLEPTSDVCCPESFSMINQWGC